MKDGDVADWLTVYDISEDGDGGLSQLDKVEVRDMDWHGRPRIDSSGRVYVPCRLSGVRVFHCQNGRLLEARDPLRSLSYARTICVNTADTVFVGDWSNDTVCIVSVSTDTVARHLEKPAQVRGHPNHVAVLGQTALVCYGDNTLVTYRSDSSTPGQVLQAPREQGEVTSITTDSHSSSFLITDFSGHVYLLDDKFIWHRIYTGVGALMDCAVTQSQLWLGYYVQRGIVVLTSQ